jgi:hypothetical protein
MTTRFLGTAFFVLLGATGVLVTPAKGQTIMAPSAADRAIVAPSPLEQSMEATPAPAGPQKYDGVVPGAAAKNPLPRIPKAGVHLVWTGFQMTPTGSRVFLQTTQTVQFSLDEGRPSKKGKSILSVRLPGCRIFMNNNRRRIDTRYFATPVSGVSARQKGRDVEVRITLREVASAVPHSEAGPDGTQFVVLDFPPGKATPEPSPLEEMAKASGLSDSIGAPGVGTAGDSDADTSATSDRPAKKARKSQP